MAITTCGHAGRDQNGRAVARVSARPMLAPFSRENGSGSKSSYGAFIAARTTLRIGMPTHLRTRGRMRTETH